MEQTTAPSVIIMIDHSRPGNKANEEKRKGSKEPRAKSPGDKKGGKKVACVQGKKGLRGRAV